MESTDYTENHDHRMKGNEDSITFRPSPNFKHMKKYLKSKFEEENNLIALKALESHGNQTSSADELEKENSPTAGVQPPLPPNPPPPDSPLNTTVKEEIDDENPQLNSDPYSTDNQTEGLKLLTEFKTDDSDVDNNVDEVMCRNYIRGTCTRGDTCIFVHKVIVSQLPSVYRFCNDFQNTVCNYRKCKFVHATVFEKEHFFRTGYLPPHTLNHLKEVNPISQPPPPPPPAEAIQTQPTPVFNHPPPQPVFRVPATPVISCVPAASLETRPVDNNPFPSVQPEANSPQKRDWSFVDDSGNVHDHQDVGESPPKKCKSCDINNLRVKYARHQLENLVRTYEGSVSKINLLAKKSNKLYTVLAALMKPLATMEQQNVLTSNNRLSSLLAEEPNVVTGSNNMNIVNLLANFLLRDQSLPSDAS